MEISFFFFLYIRKGIMLLNRKREGIEIASPRLKIGRRSLEAFLHPMYLRVSFLHATSANRPSFALAQKLVYYNDFVITTKPESFKL